MKKILGIIVILALSTYAAMNIFASQNVQEDKSVETVANVGEREMKVHYIDVGQADSILIQSPSGKNILVDAGNVDDYDKVAEYLEQQGVSKLDIVIVTHPHEDHIGSMGRLAKVYKSSRIYVSDVPKSVMNSSEKYLVEKPQKELESAASSNGISIQTAYAGMTIPVDDKINLEVISPEKGQNHKLVNNYGITFKVKYLDTSFLFTGDIEKAAEEDILRRYSENLSFLKVDVLKVPHHGAISSSTPGFLIATAPKYSVTSVGKNNPFGFPDEAVSKRLMVLGENYRTDATGTVVVSSDGYKINVTTEKNDEAYSYYSFEK